MLFTEPPSVGFTYFIRKLNVSSKMSNRKTKKFHLSGPVVFGTE